jgi:PAS domain S-box-containing protein
LLDLWQRQIGQVLPDSWRASVASTLESGSIVETEVACGERVFALHLVPVLDTGYANLYGLDITGLKAAEGALRESEEMYRTLVATSPDAITVTDLSGRITNVSLRTLEMHGYDGAGELVGKSSLDLIGPEERGRAVENLQKVLREGSIQIAEYTLLRKDGTRFTGELSAALIRDADGRPRAFIGAMRDLTERKRLEEQLRQAQKMEAIGQLAGGIAHDFNNLLTVINGYSQLLLASLEPDSALRPDLAAVLQAGERAASLMRQLLAFSRRQILEVRVLNLNEVIEGMAKMLHRIIGEDISLRLRLSGDLGNVKADPGQLEQVVVNLAVNGRDAMPGGGVLTLETANIELDEAIAGRHVTVAPGRYVMLAISDSGTGISGEVRKHLFEPFFTTKQIGKGTGLGLATVYGIVKQSGGDINVYSEVGQGTCFKVYLPRVDDGYEKPQAPEAVARPPEGRETVLLVEDEDEVRDFASVALRRLGYTVFEARMGDEAIEFFRQSSIPIHLVLTDVVMSGMSGKEMVDRLLQIGQGFRVLYMSGYTGDAIVHHGVLDPGTPFIQKPFTIEAIARKLREVLDEGQAQEGHTSTTT